ncbi:MAG: hypothetical protein JO180_12535 [Gemmatirosa sp.]|nr:hypothetical protein [Gemmatirosa sp.]
MSDAFEVSKEGVKLSYERFLSDGAAGYVLIAAVALLVAAGAPPPFGMERLPMPRIGTELRVLLGVITILLGPALGLLLNGASWFVFGTAQVIAVDLLFKWSRTSPAQWSASQRAFDLHWTRQRFGLDSRWTPPVAGARRTLSLYDAYCYAEEGLRLWRPDLWNAVSYIHGVKHFARALALLSLLGAGYAFSIAAWRWAFWMLAVTVVFVALTGAVAFYQCLVVLFRVHLLTMEAPAAVSGGTDGIGAALSRLRMDATPLRASGKAEAAG